MWHYKWHHLVAKLVTNTRSAHCWPNLQPMHRLMAKFVTNASSATCWPKLELIKVSQPGGQHCTWHMVPPGGQSCKWCNCNFRWNWVVCGLQLFLISDILSYHLYECHTLLHLSFSHVETASECMFRILGFPQAAAEVIRTCSTAFYMRFAHALIAFSQR